MKIIVITDSHGELSNIINAYETEHPDIILPAGDCYDDIKELSYIYNDLKYESVRGNCDYFTDIPDQNRLLQLEGQTIFLTHGHLYGVKLRLDELERQSQKLCADIVVFGHTHKPYLNKLDNVIYFNPGAMRDGRYGVITIHKDEVQCFQKQI